MESLPIDQQPLLRIKTQPNDANASGDIFGGWLMSQIDIAGAILAAQKACGPVVTVAVKELVFLKPLYIYDLVSFYGDIVRTGKTSITVSVEVFAQRIRKSNIETVKVSDALLVYVAVTEPGVKRSL